MADFEMWSVFWFLCMMCVAPVKIHCQLVKVFGVCVIPWKEPDKVHGFKQWQDRRGHQACPLQMMRGIQTCSAADIATALDIDCILHTVVWDQPDYREVCAHWVPKNPTDDDKVHCMGLSCIHWTCYTDQREQFWRWNMVNYAKPDTRKRMCDRETIISLQQRKWSIVISKLENCLGTLITCLFCISLTMVTLWWLLLWYT